MNMPTRTSVAFALLAALSACAVQPVRPSIDRAMQTPMRVTEHRGSDDLLSAGLGLDGLRSPVAPAFATPAAPGADELRRRALWANWRGIADLSPAGGYGSLYGRVPPVPGREYHALARVPGARHPHRVLVQAPDAFDAAARCLVVAASSGSRGIYGAIAVAGAWGLPRGCAVAYTDKAAGTDYFDLDARRGVRLDGTVGAAGEALAFEPESGAPGGVAFKHAHSGDNPEADWGEHVRQAAEFGLKALADAYPQQAPFTFENTRVIAVGVSNGAGAVLRAAESAEPWLDAVVAGEPNVFADAAGSRALYDYATEAALLMPCALPHLGLPAMPGHAERCEALAQAGRITGSDFSSRQRSAYDALRAGGWSDEALRAGSISVGFDLWRAVAAGYASAYGRYAVDSHPCGFRYVAQAPDGATRAATDVERAAWWSDASGIPPGAGVNLIAPQSAASPLEDVQCLRALWNTDSADARRVREGVAATRAAVPRRGLPVFVVHGVDDGLVPMAFSSAPYVAAAREAGRDVRFWQVRNAQHFDAFLGFPQYGAQYVPLLPYVYRALDLAWAHVTTGDALPGDRVIETTPRGTRSALTAADLAMP